MTPVHNTLPRLAFPRLLPLLLLISSLEILTAQAEAPVIDSLDLAAAPAGRVSRYWLHLVDDALGRPVVAPVLVAKGARPGPVLGLVAAIHGDELNGIPIIQTLMRDLDPTQLRGTIVGVPVLNVPGLNLEQRDYLDGQDLNRLLPGETAGDVSRQYAFRLFDRLVSHVDYLIDMHTASAGRVNTFYVRAETADDTISQLAWLQGADILLQSGGQPSVGATGSGRTLRAEAMRRGIPAITVEYGNPLVYQDDMRERGLRGVRNTLVWLGMLEGAIAPPAAPPTICTSSYWLYTDAGGLLEVPVELNQRVQPGELIGILRNAFGDVIREYYAPEAGIIIGKSTNPVNWTGGRIVHLGVGLTNH